MLVDCQTCPVRNVHCADCMVTALSALPILTAPMPSPVSAPASARTADEHTEASGAEDRTVPLDRAERRAVSALLGAGLVSTTTANAARAVLEPRPTRTERSRHAG
jgi:hypothetical protein